ncbi:MAG: redoxin domain-containing protein [Proteobacteria bacterium]|nr:redoxin domain-containing protein [Pseudomonadota bacterium]MBU1649271.1 redoxin domain-containing protein [Pseudomonadota bacterium]
MKTTTYFPFRQKTCLIILVMTITLLQSSISTPALQTLGVGTEAPDFTLQDFSGKKQGFSALKGDKLTLVLFWASWSRQSEKALKQMEKLQQKYKNQGFSVIGINVERQTIDAQAMTDIKGTTDRLQISFPNLVDHGLIAFHDYGVIAVPTTVILDKDRKIIFEMSGFPLVGTTDMIHFLAATIEGKSAPAEVAKKIGYQPDKKAVRAWNMGVKALSSERTAHTAEMWFKKAISADPDFILPHLNLGTYYQEQGDLAQAKEQFQQALTRKPDNASALSKMGLLLLNEGSIAAAKTMLEKAIKADESYVPSYYYLGYLTGKEGDMKKATELFASAEGLNPMDYQINVYRGRMFEEKSNLEQAATSYKNALKQLLNRK